MEMFTCGPLDQKRSKEKYGEPTRAIAGAGLSIDNSCVQSASISLQSMTAECGPSITLGIYIQHLPSRQYQPRWSRGSTSCNPSSHLQSPGGLSCISSPSVPYTWLVHMALNYSKDRPLAPGVELPTTPLHGDAFLV